MFVWKTEGWFVNLLDKCHGIIGVAIFMSAVKHVEDYNNKLIYNVTVYQFGHLPKVVPGCAVSKT